MAITRAPANLASAIAAPPTPDPAAVTSTVSPALRPARENSMWYAVRYTDPAAAAVSYETASGEREQVPHGRHDLLRIASVVVHAHHAVVGTGRLIAFEAVRAAAAREVVVDVDPGPRRDLRDAVSDLDHLTRDVVAGDDRERRAVRMADVLAHPDVEPVHGHGRDTDERLARPRRRGGAIDELQHLRPAVPLHDDRPHQ